VCVCLAYQAVPAFPTACHAMPCPFALCPHMQAVVRNLNLTLPPSEQCTSQMVSQQVGAIQSMSGSTQTAWAEGQTVHIVRLVTRLPVLNSTDGTQSEASCAGCGGVGVWWCG